MISTKTIILILSAMLFFAGTVISILFIEPANETIFMNPAADLAMVSAGIFFLSILFWGRFAFVPMFFAGIWAGGLFGEYPIYAGMAAIPLLMAVATGCSIGKRALNDFYGNENLFDRALDYFAILVFVIIIAAAIGAVAPYQDPYQLQVNAERILAGKFAIS